MAHSYVIYPWNIVIFNGYVESPEGLLGGGDDFMGMFENQKHAKVRDWFKQCTWDIVGIWINKCGAFQKKKGYSKWSGFWKRGIFPLYFLDDIYGGSPKWRMGPQILLGCSRVWSNGDRRWECGELPRRWFADSPSVLGASPVSVIKYQIVDGPAKSQKSPVDRWW